MKTNRSNSDIANELKKNKVFKAGIGYTIGNYALKGINFILLPIFARIMSTEDYGSYNLYLSYESMLSIFLSLALYTSIKSAKVQFGEKITEYVPSIMSLMVVFCVGMLGSSGKLGRTSGEKRSKCEKK